MRDVLAERPVHAPADGPAWHTETVERVAAALGTSLHEGLAPEEAARRLAEHGPNEIESEGGTPAWQLLLAQFRNVLVLILLAAVALSAALGHTTETIVIGVIVLFAALLGFVQEYRAERAIDALRELAAPTATVVRGGDEVDVPARELVPGDLVLIEAGDRASADARLVEAATLQVEEAALTGESVAVDEDGRAAPRRRRCRVGDRRNLIFGGTAVAGGRGRARRRRHRHGDRARRHRRDAPDDRAREDAAPAEPRPRRPCSSRAAALVARGRGRRPRPRCAASRSSTCSSSASRSRSRSCRRRCRP